MGTMMSSIRKIIGSRIKAHRKSRGLTQSALAEAIECEVASIGRYERAETAPDGEQLIKMAEFFEISPMDLLPVKIDVKLQAVLDLRSELIDLVRTINDPSQLERLIGVAKESTQPERGR
ncbi:PbsX-like transcriptional regulator [Pseudomonas amygdali pv. lachrymans]|uniref:PbsX-like transcriptional regulator n=11 Tax=Pseudomonas syringae group TaxID=136849 RepID=A0A0P9KZC2_PSECA|nr:PbsX-like transcriptional regulator [Pseudomonas cannabina]RMN38396.1 PbsX-like transcriptional regulator [Pseudomonas cannabina]RMU13352.1 PbsX-like transcriptional regulator [Pseudomonas amygdali pv. lachrymans]